MILPLRVCDNVVVVVVAVVFVAAVRVVVASSPYKKSLLLPRQWVTIAEARCSPGGHDGPLKRLFCCTAGSATRSIPRGTPGPPTTRKGEPSGSNCDPVAASTQTTQCGETRATGSTTCASLSCADAEDGPPGCAVRRGAAGGRRVDDAPQPMATRQQRGNKRRVMRLYKQGDTPRDRDYTPIRQSALRFTIPRSTLWPTRSRMLLYPYLIMVGLQRQKTSRQYSNIHHCVCIPFQRQSPRNHNNILGKSHREKHFRTEDPRVANLHQSAKP
jgi:hypothetical protein